MKIKWGHFHLLWSIKSVYEEYPVNQQGPEIAVDTSAPHIYLPSRYLPVTVSWESSKYVHGDQTIPIAWHFLVLPSASCAMTFLSIILTQLQTSRLCNMCILHMWYLCNTTYSTDFLRVTADPQWQNLWLCREPLSLEPDYIITLVFLDYSWKKQTHYTINSRLFFLK